MPSTTSLLCALALSVCVLLACVHGVAGQSTHVGSGSYQYDDPAGATANALTEGGLQLKAPSSNTATCGCTAAGCAATPSTVGYQQVFYWHTGNCGTTNPYVNRIAFQSADSTTKFRMFTTRSSNLASGPYFYGAGSSMKLTVDSVRCFNAAFQPGYGTALIPLQGGTGELYVVLYCDTPGGCSFNWNIDGGCTAAAVTSTVGGFAMDSCLSSCNPQGGTCSSGTCTCSGGWSGARCSIASAPADPCASVDCGAHGTCSGGSCTCRDGYTGTTCSIAPGACLSGQTCTNGQCYTAGGMTTTVSCSCICSNGNMQPLTGATNCGDCTTRCAATSCTSGTSCSTSSSSSSPTATGATCGTAAAASSSTGSASTSPAGVYDATVWLGTYTIASGCDQTKCCCAQASTITASGTSYTVTGTNLAGQCGTSVPTSVQASASTPTSDTVTYTINGQSHTATRQSDGGIVDRNNADASCSATLTKSSINSAPSAPFQPFHLFAVVLVSAVAAIVTF